jgi:hypothetical protein
MSSDEDEDLLDLDATMERINEMRISSLGDGFDETSLVELDRKLNLWFLEEEQEDYLRKPTDAEIQHYTTSILLRKTALGKAHKHQIVIDRLSGRDSLNECIYEEFHKDMKKYPYAWLGIIFDNKEDLPSACSALQVLKSLARLKYENREIDIFKDVMELYGEALGWFEMTVSDAEDEEYYDNVGNFKWERYELNAFAAKWMATMQIMYKPEAIQYFRDALAEESVWEYQDRYCRIVLEHATGSTMSIDDLTNIEMMMEEGDEFLWKCLLAMRDGERGTVKWSPTSFCQTCGWEETKDKKLLQCSRCLRAFYCTKECQKIDWKGHKLDCKK